MKEYTIAFVGNPNVGKSAWINALSHANFKVGNWPGVTVEKKEAVVTWNQENYHFIDLPGCYSLSYNANEERITDDYLRNQPVDLIVNVVDASHLSRNLYLTLLLRELQIPMLIIFNFMDVVHKAGTQIDIDKISRRLQIPILAVSAFHTADHGVVRNMIEQQKQATGFYYPLLCNEDVETYVSLYNYLDEKLPAYVSLSEQQRHVITYELLKRSDTMFSQMESWQMDVEVIHHLCKDMDEQKINRNRYRIIEQLLTYVKEKEDNTDPLTRRLDRIFLHRYAGLPIFFLIFTILLLFVFQFSAPWNAFIEFIIHDIIRNYLSVGMQSFPLAIKHLMLDGILSGVGGVLSFVPMLSVLYMALSFLEESGYMSRIACLLDRMMRVFHLSGKSFVSLILGFGCNVPAIYATRTLDNENQKRLTAVLIPFMSCGARLPVYVLFASAFFPHKAALMILSIYGIGIFLALLIALLLSKHTGFKEEGIFVLELPSYHMPSLKVVFHKVKEEVKGYIKKAFGVVMWAMILLWSISYFPHGDMQSSYMATFAKQIAPIFEPAGFGTRWECVASLPGGIVAKETIVGYFATIFEGAQEETKVVLNPKEDLQNIKDEFILACQSSIHDTLFPSVNLKAEDETDVKHIHMLWQDELANLRAFCFMVYVLLSIPCVMTLQALYREYGIKLLLLSLIIMTLLPYVVSVGIFQLFSIL
ncbi:ferrous iron transport protein B [[Eubacterium] hominis]|uniref:ferrous iron transport protein B n=1 Tax=[Eubacterium] hominis TaxID=2764325 RepID=UPI003A4DA585